MELTDIVRRYWPPLSAQSRCSITTEQRCAVNAMLGCRTEQYGTIELACRSCATYAEQYLACGHRFCHRCQHHNTRQWLTRQQQKLLPTKYFMVTFTLPFELRTLAKAHPKTVYAALFQSAVSTLKDFGQNDTRLQANLGLTAVLHTHSRKLDYHPHVHVVVPGGGVHRNRKEWRKLKGNYLFNGKALAKVFRARMLTALTDSGFIFPKTPNTWVTQCQDVGYGDSAIKYLSRYLYRGVISNKNIVRDDGKNVTFQYTDSRTKTIKTRTLRGEDFLKLILQHVLPKGFRRVRDYGFLHGNAKALLKTIQWILQVAILEQNKPTPVRFICTYCQHVMVITNITKPKWQPG